MTTTMIRNEDNRAQATTILTPTGTGDGEFTEWVWDVSELGVAFMVQFRGGVANWMTFTDRVNLGQDD